MGLGEGRPSPGLGWVNSLICPYTKYGVLLSRALDRGVDEGPDLFPKPGAYIRGVSGRDDLSFQQIDGSPSMSVRESSPATFDGVLPHVRRASTLAALNPGNVVRVVNTDDTNHRRRHMPIDEYFPDIEPRQWTEVRGWVMDIVRDVDGHTPYTSRDIALAVSRLAVWASNNLGIELERDVLLRREFINRFIGFGCKGQTEATRSNLRAQLLRVAETLLDPSLAPVRLAALGPADPSQPYDSGEIARLSSWANGQRTEARRRNAEALIALGLGAGLSASEIGNLRAQDVDASEGGVTVHVRSGRVRAVPVIAEWESSIAARAEELEPSTFMFRPGHAKFYPNLISNFVSRGRWSEVLPQTQRLRATWIVRHLDAGTPIAPLIAAAGVDSLEAMTRYVRFLVPVAEPEANRLLRLSRTSKHSVEETY